MAPRRHVEAHPAARHVGLIGKLKQPKAKVYFADKQLLPNDSLRQTHREWHIEDPEEARELVSL